MTSYKFTDPQIKLMRKAMNSSQFSLTQKNLRQMNLEEHLQYFIEIKTCDFWIHRRNNNFNNPVSFNNWAVKFSKNYRVKRSYDVYNLDELKFLYIVCRIGLTFNPEKRQENMYKKIIENILTHLFIKVYK
jgi:hypothetical protein